LSLLVIPGSLFTVCDRGKRRQYPSNSQVAIPFLPSLSRLARRVGSRRDRRPEQNPRPPSPGGWPTAPPPAPTSRPIPSNPVGIGTRVGNPYVVQQRAPSSAHRPGRELRAATCSAQRPGREQPDCVLQAPPRPRAPRAAWVVCFAGHVRPTAGCSPACCCCSPLMTAAAAQHWKMARGGGRR
jgi:hypothetical protein